MSEPIEETKQPLLKKYYSPTPPKWRKLGDSILWISIGLQPMTQTLPMSDNMRLWVNFGIGVIGVAGKALTNFFTDDAS